MAYFANLWKWSEAEGSTEAKAHSGDNSDIKHAVVGFGFTNGFEKHSCRLKPDFWDAGKTEINVWQ